MTNFKSEHVIEKHICKLLDALDRLGIPYDTEDMKQLSLAIRLSYTGDEIRAKYNVVKRLIRMMKFDKEREDKDYYQRLIDSNTSAVTLKSMVASYGKKEGERRFNEYKSKQSIKNTFEFKHKKYGMTKDEFNTFNKSRACTKDNFISRHGEEKGSDMWESYRKRQSYAGCKLQYFIEKYGEEEGKNRYLEIGRKKALTLESVMKRYNCSEEDAIKHLDEIYAQRNKRCLYSSSGLEFAKCIEADKCLSGKAVLYGENEFGKWSHLLNSYVFYDVTIPELKLIFEFDGDYYHANPNRFSPDDVVSIAKDKKLKASDIWMRDKMKAQTAEDLGFEVCRVWENDYKSNKGVVMDRCHKKIVEKLNENSNRN